MFPVLLLFGYLILFKLLQKLKSLFWIRNKWIGGWLHVLLPEQIINENHVTNSFLLFLVILSLIVLTQHDPLYSKLYGHTDSAICILTGGSPSNAVLAEPEQAWLEEWSRLAFTASHLVAWSVVIEMIIRL